MWRKLFQRRAPSRARDPAVAYDGWIRELERRGAEVRQSAATLLTLRAELLRELERWGRQRGEWSSRLDQARARSQGSAAEVLEGDLAQLRSREESARESLVQVEQDAALL